MGKMKIGIHNNLRHKRAGLGGGGRAVFGGWDGPVGRRMELPASRACRAQAPRAFCVAPPAATPRPPNHPLARTHTHTHNTNRTFHNCAERSGAEPVSIRIRIWVRGLRTRTRNQTLGTTLASPPAKRGRRLVCCSFYLMMVVLLMMMMVMARTLQYHLFFHNVVGQRGQVFPIQVQLG